MNRKMVKVDVEVTTPVGLETIRKQRGMTKVVMLSRLVRWFARQDDEIQAEILRAPESPSADLAHRLLRRMASNKR